jgi:hypothetical protein
VTRKKSTKATRTKLDPMVLAEVKRIIRPTQKYIILSETEALLVPR